MEPQIYLFKKYSGMMSFEQWDYNTPLISYFGEDTHSNQWRCD